MVKKKIGFFDMFTKDSSYINRASVCSQCGKEFLAEKNKYGKYDYTYCEQCKDDYKEYMKGWKDKKKQEMKEMYNQNYYDITEVKNCAVCNKEYRSNIDNCDTCNVCIRKEVRRKKGFKDVLRDLDSTYYDLYPRTLNCVCLDCGKEYIINSNLNDLKYLSRCEECIEDREEYKKSFVGREKSDEFKCIVCGEYFIADSNKFICPKCQEEKENSLYGVVACKECGMEFKKKNIDDILCENCIDNEQKQEVCTCSRCGKELFFGQVCNCKNIKL